MKRSIGFKTLEFDALLGVVEAVLMFVSNFGAGIICCFLNLLFYGIYNNERLDQFTPLDTDVHKRNKTYFGSNNFLIQKCKHLRVKSFDHQLPPFILSAEFLPDELDLLKPVIAGSAGCRLLLDGLVTTPSSESGSESWALRLVLKNNFFSSITIFG